MMNNIELEAVRRFLFLSVPEAARMVSETSEAAWRKWEYGKNPVPVDVQSRLRMMLEYREGVVDMLDGSIGKILDESETGELNIPLIWYDSVDDFLTYSEYPMFWRPYCSAISEICASYHSIHLVKFNQKSYHEWLNSKQDNEDMRLKWAASKIKHI